MKIKKSRQRKVEGSWVPWVLWGVVGSSFDLVGEVVAFPFDILAEGFRFVF